MGPDIQFGMPLKPKKLAQKISEVLADAGVGFTERKAAFMANPCGQQSFIKVHTIAPPFLFIEGLFLFTQESLCLACFVQLGDRCQPACSLPAIWPSDDAPALLPNVGRRLA